MYNKKEGLIFSSHSRSLGGSWDSPANCYILSHRSIALELCVALDTEYAL